MNVTSVVAGGGYVLVELAQQIGFSGQDGPHRLVDARHGGRRLEDRDAPLSRIGIGRFGSSISIEMPK